MSTLIKDIPEGMKRDWKVEVNGKEIPEVWRVRISSEYGELNYGKTPGGWDGWSFHQAGGGGSVIIPFAYLNSQLYVGVVEEFRHYCGGEVLNVPRGYLNPGETHFEAARRELAEETGYEPPEKRFVLLPGEPLNPESGSFETPGKDDEGVRIYALQVRLTELVITGSGVEFKKDLLKKTAEKITGCKFLPWEKAVLVGDMYTVAAIGRLVAYLESK